MESLKFQVVIDGSLVSVWLAGHRSTRRVQCDLGQQLQHLIPFRVQFQDGSERWIRLVLTGGQTTVFKKRFGFDLFDSTEALQDLFVAESKRLMPVLRSDGNELCTN